MRSEKTKRIKTSDPSSAKETRTKKPAFLDLLLDAQAQAPNLVGSASTLTDLAIREVVKNHNESIMPICLLRLYKIQYS